MFKHPAPLMFSGQFGRMAQTGIASRINEGLETILNRFGLALISARPALDPAIDLGLGADARAATPCNGDVAHLRRDTCGCCAVVRRAG